MRKVFGAVYAALVTLILAIALNEKAYSLSISDHAGNTVGFAEMFTPQKDFSFSSLTLSASGYYDLSGPNSSLLNLSLDTDWNYVQPSFPYHEPFGTIAQATATINSSTGPDYNFNISETLQAGVPYWFFIYLQSPDAGGQGVGCNVNGLFGTFNSVQSSSPQVDLLIDGSEPYVNGFNPAQFMTIGTDITIFSASEPGTNACILLGSLILGSYLLRPRVSKWLTICLT